MRKDKKQSKTTTRPKQNKRKREQNTKTGNDAVYQEEQMQM